MYILIEHNGTSDHLQFANKIQDYLEEEFGATVEMVVGSSERTIILYSDELKKIVELSPSDDLSTLIYYIHAYYEDEL